MGRRELIKRYSYDYPYFGFYLFNKSEYITLIAASVNNDICVWSMHDADVSTGLLSSSRISAYFNALDASPDNAIYGVTSDSLYIMKMSIPVFYVDN